jgi:hypothetical protein
MTVSASNFIHRGRVRAYGDGTDDLRCLTSLISGEIAERMSRGQLPRFNWLRDDEPGSDGQKAKWFASLLPDPHYARELAESRAYAGLTVRWAGVQALAAELERRTSSWVPTWTRSFAAPVVAVTARSASGTHPR